MIAGTPTGWSWNTHTKTFRLTFTVRAANARRLTSSTSEIFIPKSSFSHGYRVTVHGAAVIQGRPSSQLLVLHTSHGARKVSVVVQQP